MTATVTALVVSYHTGPRLVECLYALKGDPDVAAIVITDNGNPPGTEAWLDAFVAATPKAQIVRLPNPGFGAGVNAAARPCRERSSPRHQSGLRHQARRAPPTSRGAGRRAVSRHRRRAHL